MSRNIVTGIDAGSSAIRIITAEQKNGGLNILSACAKPSEGIKKGYVANLEDASGSIKNTITASAKMSGMPIKKALISIGGISLGSAKAKGSIMISRADSEVSDYDVKRAIDQSEENIVNLSNKHIIHSIPLSFKIDNSVVLGRPTGMKGTKMEVETLFITCLNQHLSDIIKAVETAGVAVEDVIASPLAMANTVLTKQQKEAGCVLTNIGANTVSVAVFDEGLPVSLEVFPIGSTHITNDIALCLQIPLDEAEKLKIEYGTDGSISKKKLSDIIEARLNDIFELIESHLKKINRNGVLPAGIILTGGGSNLFSLEEIAKASMRLPAKIGTMSSRENHLKITSTSNSLKDQIINDPGWSTALGLCFMNNNGDSYGDNALGRAGRNAGKTLTRWLKNLMP